MFVICKTKRINAITIVSTEGIPFKKNYMIYFACLQIPFVAFILILVYCFKAEEPSMN